MESPSSSEDDEEERKKLAEVAGIATKEINQALTVNLHQSSSQKSLRTSKLDEKDEGFQLTPEFQKHVAKKLSSFIESCIQEELNYSTPQTKKNDKQMGINLFHSSKEKITDFEEFHVPKTPKRTQKSRHQNHCTSESESSDDEDALAMFKEAAVSAQSILGCGLKENTGKTTEDDKQINDLDTKNENDHRHKKKKKKKKKELKKQNEEEGHRKRKKNKKSSIS